MSLSFAMANDFGSDSTDVPSSSDEMPAPASSASYSGILRYSGKVMAPLTTYAPIGYGSQPCVPPGRFWKQCEYQNGGAGLIQTRIHQRTQTPPPSHLPALPPQLPPPPLPPPPPQHAPILQLLGQQCSSPPLVPAESQTSSSQFQVASPGSVDPVLPSESQESRSLPSPGMEMDKSFPSEGSVLHGTGKCIPCAWFWKPQGCDHGSKCFRCHLCPIGEVKTRKKAKHIATKQQKAAAKDTPQSDGCIDTAPILSCRDSEEARFSRLTSADDFLDASVTAAQLQLPSHGSARHASGTCEPCAFFWKAEGCQHGQQCNRCHLCPQGAVKARRKAKLAIQRSHPGAMDSHSASR